MASIDPGRTTRRTEVRTRHPDETKPFYMTSEFLTLVAAAAGVLIATAVVDELDAPRAWLYVTILASAYMIARGLAKSGSRHWGDGSGTRD